MFRLLAVADRRCGSVSCLVQQLFCAQALASRGTTCHNVDKCVFELFWALLSSTLAPVYIWISTVHAACSGGKDDCVYNDTVITYLLEYTMSCKSH